MRRDRGGVMLFVLVMVSLMTVAVLAGVELSTSAALVQSRRESEARAQFAVDGAIQYFLCDYRKKSQSVPANANYSVGGLPVNLIVEDYSGTKAHTLKFVGTAKIQNKIFAFTRITGDRLDPRPFDYALAINSGLDPNRPITLGENGSNGDLLVNGAIVNRANPFVINGDVETTGTTLPTGSTIKGNTLSGETAVAFPTLNGANYLVASLLNLLVSSLSDYVFPAMSPYALIYRLGNLDMRGTMTGLGTVFVQGNVHITGNISYGNTSSRLVVIATGDIDIDASVTKVSGFYYAGGAFRTAGTLEVNPGSVAAGSISMGGPLTVIHDPTFWNVKEEGAKHRAPGYWP